MESAEQGTGSYDDAAAHPTILATRMSDDRPARSDPAEAPRPSDVLVVGGGPAAATAARLLTLWGHEVEVAVRPASGDPALPESLTPSCRKFFDLLGITADIEAAGFVASLGHTVWWGGSERVEPFGPGQHGWQATTTRLGAVMLDAAVRAGARVRHAALTTDQVQQWPARYRIDATGRSGVLARPLGGRRYEPGHRTVALVGRWRRADAWPVSDPSHTLLESYGDGWGWSVPVDATERALAVMVDPRTTQLTRGDGARAVYLAELGKMPHLAEAFRGSDLVARPSGWDASMYLAETLTGDGWLLAGDAASFVDPLSSAGVKKAMASGWLAAVAVNTALTQPAMAATAFEFFAARERDTYAQFLALTRRFLLDGAPTTDHPFWADRSAPDPGDGRAAVIAAHERIRTAATISFRVAPEVSFAPRPSLTERVIVLEERLVTALVPEGVRYVGDVDVVAVVRLAPSARDVPNLFAEYVRRVGPVDLHSFLKTLATAVARGWLLTG